jgi:hypothetical protein
MLFLQGLGVCRGKHTLVVVMVVVTVMVMVMVDVMVIVMVTVMVMVMVLVSGCRSHLRVSCTIITGAH